MTEAAKIVAELMALADAFADGAKAASCYGYRIHEGMTSRIALEAAIRRAVDWGEPVAWATHHEPPMLWDNKTDASSYCDDDEEPIPLYARRQDQ